jgi:chlorophyll(ide) b reductase
MRTMATQTKDKNALGYHIFNMEGAGSDGMETRKYAAYGFTKAGLSQLTKTLNKEMSSNEKMKDKMIKVHTVSPGMVFTDLISSGRYAFGKQGRMFVNALAEPADVAASGLVRKIKTELGNSQGKKSLAIKMLTPDVAAVKLFNRFVKQVGKDRYYPEEEEECEDVRTECIVPGESVQSTMVPEAQMKLDDEETKEVEVSKEEVQENLSR